MRRAGFTVIEVMIVLALIAIFAALVGGAISPFFTADRQRKNAEELAKIWTSSMYPGKPVGVICQGTDTDGDGYVSCTAKIDEERIALDCYSYVWFSQGNTCRERIVPIGGVRR